MRYRFEDIAINSTKKKQPTDADREVYIGLEHIDSEDFQVHRWGSDVTPAGEKLIMSKGDVLFGKRRAYQRKVAIAPFDGIFSAHGMVLRPKTDVICAEFFPFFIASDQFMETAIRISVGGLSPTINWKDLKVQEFELPPLEEQKRLALQLQAAYRLKEAYKRLLVATDEMVKSQFTEMFGNETKTVDLSELIEVTFPGEWGKEPTSDSGIKVIRTTNFTNEGKLDLTDVVVRDIDAKKVKRKILQCGDIILERSGGTKENPVGRVVLFEEKGDYLFNNFTQLLRSNSSVNSTYLFYALYNNYNLDKASMRAISSQTTGIQNLNMTEYMSREIKLPPRDLQDQFATIYRQADKSKFDGFKSQFLEMFGDFEKTTTLDSISEAIFAGGDKPKACTLEKTNVNKYPVIANGIDNDGVIGYASSYRVDSPSLTISARGTIGIVSERYFLYTPVVRLIVIIPKTIVNLTYLKYQLDHIKFQSTGAVQGQLTVPNVKAIKIPIPPLSLQTQFADIVRQADKSKYNENNKNKNICHILMNPIPLRRCS